MVGKGIKTNMFLHLIQRLIKGALLYFRRDNIFKEVQEIYKYDRKSETDPYLTFLYAY